jgi:N-acetylneuraminic acid mutarotase
MAAADHVGLVESDEMTPKSDGMASVLSGTDIIMTGGWTFERIWSLSLPAVKWSEQRCGGLPPSPRLYHAAAADAKNLYVSGGELLTGDERGRPPYGLAIYRLRRSSTYNEWEQIDTAGAPPLHRSHHTMTLLSGHLVVYGGKMLPRDDSVLGSKPGFTGPITNGNMLDLIRQGFYDIYLLSLTDRTWRCIRSTSPITPSLWGHIAAPYGKDCILFHGGFEVTPYAGASESAVAEAKLNPEVFAFNLATMQWGQCTTLAQEAMLDRTQRGKGASETDRPQPRALHVGLIRHHELIIFGGISFSSSGVPALMNDCWRWDALTNNWTKVPFCLRSWKCQKLVACIYYDQLVVANSLSSLHFLDLRSFTQWQRVNCSVDTQQWVQHSPLTGGVSGVASRDAHPRSSSDFMLKQVAQHRKERDPASFPTDEEISEAELLKLELRQLQAQVELRELEEAERKMELESRRGGSQRNRSTSPGNRLITRLMEANGAGHPSRPGEFMDPETRDYRREAMNRSLQQGANAKLLEQLQASPSPKAASQRRVENADTETPTGRFRSRVLAELSTENSKPRSLQSRTLRDEDFELNLRSLTLESSPLRKDAHSPQHTLRHNEVDGLESGETDDSAVVRSLAAYRKLQAQHKQLELKRLARLSALRQKLDTSFGETLKDFETVYEDAHLFAAVSRGAPPPSNASTLSNTAARRRSSPTLRRKPTTANSTATSRPQFDDGTHLLPSFSAPRSSPLR